MPSKYFGKQTPRTPHLVTSGSGGLSGEVADLRADTEAAFVAFEAASVALLDSRLTPIQALDADGIMTAQASASAPQSFTAASFDGILAPGSGVAIIDVPKRITIVIAGGTATDYLGGTVLLTGTDVDGNAQEEEVTTAAGAGTTTSTKRFASLSQADFPASTAAGATIGLGVAAEPGCIASAATSTTALDINTNIEFARTMIGNRRMPVARALALLLTSSADFDLTSMIIDGEDANGDPISETLAIPDGGSTTVNGAKFFSRIRRIRVDAQSGSGGTWSLGIRDTILGLPRLMVNAAIAVSGLREAVRANTASAYTAPSAGTVTAPASALPNGSYTPATAPTGANGHLFAYLPG